MKSILKEKAIFLRKQGHSYSEILKEVPVAKSTLSEWLHSVNLAKHQKQRLTEKKLASAKKGGEAKRQKRIDETIITIDKAKSEIGVLTVRELWLIGIILYWAEGSKEKFYRSGTSVQFTNMDLLMINLFIKWLKEVCHIDKKSMVFEIYLHETHRCRINEIIDYWSKNTETPREHFSHIYYKKAAIKTNRKNIDETYFGVIRLKVKSSTSLNRQIAGWTQGVVEFFR
jgi:hypothetical protein